MKVFEYFEQISKIPHGSGNEKELSDYLVKFAKEHHLEVYQDEIYNVIIKKPASKGYENSPSVILQGHLDMVCEKNNDTIHDFEKNPLKLITKDDFITAQGTTLGADDGIAVAYAMAILDDNTLEHPPLEVVLTIEEETGMKGAANLKTSLLNSKYLINIDSEKEGTLLVSCAGGAKVKIKVPIKFENISDTEFKKYTLKIRGLKGGHSGEDINKNRANANKVMGRVLYVLYQQVDLKIVKINGGAKDNAIPREADVEIIINKNNYDKLEKLVAKWNDILMKEFHISDPEIKVCVHENNDINSSCFSNDTTKNIVDIINLMPNGIQTMSSEIEGLVQSSLNLGVITTEENYVVFTLALRSSKKTLIDNMMNQLKIIAKLFNSELICTSEYPAWEYNPDSKLRKIFIDVYKEIYNKEPEIKAIHAGLECGIFSRKIDKIDIISIGPNMYDIHTPDERLSISSTVRTWEYLINVLKKLK